MENNKHTTKQIANLLVKSLMDKLHSLAKKRLSANKERLGGIVNNVMDSDSENRQDEGGVESSISVTNK